MTDVHRTSPHDNHDHDHDHDHLHDTTTKGWRFGGSSPLDESSPGPGKDTHGTLGPLRRMAVGGPINAPQGEVTHNNGARRRDKRRLFRQTGAVKGDLLEDETISELELQLAGAPSGHIYPFKQLQGELEEIEQHPNDISGNCYRQN